MSGAGQVHWEDVEVGDEIKGFSLALTMTRMVLQVSGTQDFYPIHHDRDFAQQRNGTRDNFMNTPNQAAWLERFITDWAGPKARIGRYKFRMGDSICPGDTMVFTGEVAGVATDDTGCGWVDLAIRLAVGAEVKTRFTARVALPVDERDNPWARTGARWRP